MTNEQFTELLPMVLECWQQQWDRAISVEESHLMADATILMAGFTLEEYNEKLEVWIQSFSTEAELVAEGQRLIFENRNKLHEQCLKIAKEVG